MILPPLNLWEEMQRFALLFGDAQLVDCGVLGHGTYLRLRRAELLEPAVVTRGPTPQRRGRFRRRSLRRACQVARTSMR